VQDAVVRAAEAELRQDRVGARREVAVAEEQQVLRQAQLLLPQEEQVAPGGRARAGGLPTPAGRSGPPCSAGM
jgi:hypothetical protein